MSKVKFVMLSLIAAVALSAVASSPASAVTKNGYFEGNLKGASGEVEGSVGTAQLQGEISTTKIMIICTSNTLKEASIETEGKSKGAIKYGGCKLFEIKEGKKTELSVCTVEIAEFKFKDQLVEGSESGVVQDEFKPNSGSIFVEIKITGGSCLLKGTFTAEGTYLASLGDEAEVEKTEGEIVFTCIGSKVKFNGKKAAYTNTVSKLKRTNGKPFYVD